MGHMERADHVGAGVAERCCNLCIKNGNAVALVQSKEWEKTR